MLKIQTARGEVWMSEPLESRPLLGCGRLERIVLERAAGARLVEIAEWTGVTEQVVQKRAWLVPDAFQHPVK